MTTQQQSPVLSPAELRSLLVQRLDGLMQKKAHTESVTDDFLDALELMSALPLSTDGYGVFVNRLKNAYRYLRSNETGAAHYELRLLCGSIKSDSEVRPASRFRQTDALDFTM